MSTTPRVKNTWFYENKALIYGGIYYEDCKNY